MYDKKHLPFFLKISFLCLLSWLASNSLKANGKDSLYLKKYNKYIYYNTDSIFAKYNSQSYLNCIDDLYYYYDIVSLLPAEKQQEEIKRLRSIANKYQSKKLADEAIFMQIYYLPNSTKEELNEKIEKLNKLVDLASEQGDQNLKFRAMETIFNLYWVSSNYAKTFEQAHLLSKCLDQVSEKEYPRKKFVYNNIGKAYFFFKNYDKAMPFLRKSVRNTKSKYFFDTSNIEARNFIGLYYKTIGQTDSAEYYFRSALYSSDQVKNRSIHDAASLSNIGTTLAMKKDYTNAISYLKPGLQGLLIEQDYNRASAVAIDLGECYLAQKEMSKAKEMIDSAKLYIQRSSNRDLNRALYPLMSKYYAGVNNSKFANQYLDSTIATNNRYAEKYNSLNILKAEQELFEMETKAKDEEIKQRETIHRTRFFFSIGIIALITLSLMFFMNLYRKKRSAYQALVQRNRDWAEEAPRFQATEEKACEDVRQPNEEDQLLVQRLHEFITKDKMFKNLDFSLESLAKELDVNRNTLSKAINQSTGKNFNTYINEYRVKEAIRMMSNEKHNLLSIDAIALEVGFGNRISFYQAFKKITGLSPSDFRNNKK